MAVSTSFPPDINLGPLTTIFTAPADCSHVTSTMYTASSCYPSGKPLGSAYTASTLRSYNYHDEHIYFSPGICPGGWSQSPVSSTTVVGKAETTALCCEPGFTASTSIQSANDYVWRCYMNAANPPATSAAAKLNSPRQNSGAEPVCAMPCLVSAVSVAGCALSDQACQCGTGQAAIQTAITPCLLAACNAADIGIAASVMLSYCSSYSTSPATGVSSKTAVTATGATTSTSHTVLSTSSASAIQSSQNSGTTAATSTANGGTQEPSATAAVVLVTADPVFIKYRDGDFTLSSGTLVPAATSTSIPQSNGGLSKGAKIGLGVAIPLVLILIGLICCLFAVMLKKKRRNLKKSPILHQDISHDYPSAYKAELHDPSTNLITSSGILGPVAAKAELQAPTHSVALYGTHAELDAKSYQHQPTPELDTSPIAHGNLDAASKEVAKKQENTGPLTTPEEFAIPVSSPKTDEGEELEYQERRLRERREILAEREKIAREEEELRRLKRERAMGGSRA